MALTLFLKDVFAKHCLLEMGCLLDDNFSPFQWAIFPGEPVLLELRMIEVLVTTGAIRCVITYSC